ncbi:hypothetical protein GXP67_17185 [Rhodocytophaga rosea]|uniref:Uncharacterized protein n=1 Tax=Rhodocytophaga rosea TaxID=2704465 RepID=A0A6C0GJK2_9BACT|nr:ankyrin repeat domain-containing protein [Rhodocytophaga rosea]QHT68251.1 hypothetical protein GXP67_17185 [Rhodocytophaga rosea]
MMVKIIWTLIGINTLLFLAALWQAVTKTSDPAGNAMASAFTSIIGIGLFISICLMMISRHPLVLVVAGLLSCGPILIGVSLISSLIDGFKPAKPQEPIPAQAYFSSENQIALAKAISSGDTVLIRDMVTKGADVNAIEQGNATPLQFALYQIQINDFNEATIRESIRTLIALGANPDSGLAEAVKIVSAETIRVFLENGADPNLADEFGDPLLFGAGAYGKPGVLHAFVENGAHINVFNNDGWTPLMRLAYYGNWDSMIYLLEKGADYKHIGPDGKSVESLLKEYYTKNGAAPDNLPEAYIAVCKRFKNQGIVIY